MRSPSQIASFVAVCVLLTGVLAFADEPNPEVPSDYEEVPDVEPDPPPRDTLSIRVGLLHSALFDSGQGKPFFYLDTGLRYKAGQHYIDLKLPAFVAGFDFLSYTLQNALGVNQPFNLFEAANEPIQYAAYLEPAHVRLGQTFSTTFPGGQPLRLTAGIFTLFDFVFFNLALVPREPDDEFRDVNDPSARDPFVLAPGGFIAIGGNAPISEWDFALGIGPDIYQNPDYEPANGIVIYGDLEVQIDPLDWMGAYIRTRFSTYTHADKLVFTIIASYGAAFSLF